MSQETKGTATMAPPMKAVVAQKDLAQGLARARRAVTRKQTIPVLQCVRIEAAGNELRLVGTDLSVYIEARVPAEVRTPGVACVPAARLQSIVQRAPSVDLTLEVENQDLRLRWADSEYKLIGHPPEQYVNEPRIEDDAKRFTAGAVTLRRLLQRTAWARHDDDTRPYLTGVHLQLSDGSLRATATNSTAVAWASASIPAEGETDHIICSEGVRELAGLLPGFGASEIQIAVSTNTVHFDGGNFLLVARTLEGRYPELMSLVMKPPTISTVTVQREALLGTLRRLAALTLDAAIGIEITSSGLICRAQSPDIGEAVERLPATVTHPHDRIGFNADLLIKALAPWDCAQVRCELTGPRNPVRFYPVEADDEYGACVLPLIMY